MKREFQSPKFQVVQLMDENRSKDSNDFNTIDFSQLKLNHLVVIHRQTVPGGTRCFGTDYEKKFLIEAIQDMAYDIIKKARLFEQQAYDHAVAEAYEELDDLTDKAKAVVKKLRKEAK